MSSRQQINGDNNTVIAGDNNTVVNGPKPLLSKSEIAELLNVVKNLSPNKIVAPQIYMPKRLDEKLRFNNVKNWKAIFDEDCPDYDAVTTVMESYPASSDIMYYLNSLFRMSASEFEVEGEIQGDKLLTRLHGQLVDEIKESKEIRDESGSEVKYPNGAISSFVSSLLKRAVVMCKVLLVPDDDED